MIPWEFFVWPMLTCVVLVGIYIYFGMHVISRGIIFVDLSLAQVAALGATVALLIGFELGSAGAYLLSLAAALIGATVFTFTRNIEHKVPQEAIIGIVYAVSAAVSILLVSHRPEGTEFIRHLLVGSILTVTPDEFFKIVAVSLLIGGFHFVLRRKFLSATFRRNGQFSYARWWDFLFYASFAVVVTSSVHICGVLLVFVLLVAPSVFAAVAANSVRNRLILGWIFGLIGCALGLWLSFVLDTPSGATIVATFGLMLLISLSGWKLLSFRS